MSQLGQYTCKNCRWVHVRIPMQEARFARRECFQCGAPAIGSNFYPTKSGEVPRGATLQSIVMRDQMQFIDVSIFTDLRRMRAFVRRGMMVRLARGIYATPADIDAHRGYLIEHVAQALRPGHLSYVSLEYRLSELSVISQVCMILTVATTGSSGLVHTRVGRIEFTHVDRMEDEIRTRCFEGDERPMPVASKLLAYEDLVNADRNLNMVDMEELAVSEE